MGLRVLRGLAGDARPARRQGRQRRGDDAHPGRRARAGRVHDHDRGVRGLHARRTAFPDGLDEQVDEALARAGGARGQAARRPRRPAAGVGALGRARVDAGDARHRPEPRPQRRVGRRGWPRRPATSASPGTPTGASCRCSATSCSASRASASRTRSSASRPTAASSDDTELDVEALRELDADASRSSTTSRPIRASSSSRRSAPCSTPGRASARSTYRRINRIPDDWGTAVNVQQMVFGNKGDTSGSGVAFSRDEVTGAPEPSRRLPGQRPGRGRRLAACATRCDIAELERRDCPRSTTQLHGDPAHARAPLRRHAGHRVHGRGGPAVHAADAQRQAPGAGGGALRGRRGGRGAARQGRRRSRRSTPRRSTRCCTRPSTRRPSTTCSPAAWPPRRARRRARSSSPPPTRSPAAADGRDVILVRPFTEADDVAGFHAAQGDPDLARAARPRTRRSSRAGWACRR